MGDRKAVDEIHLFHRESTRISLENGGGVVKTVGDDPFAPGEGGMDGLADEFGPAGGKKKKLRFRFHGMTGGIVLQELADGFTERSSPGFADFMYGQLG